jgi:uncharacterized tellurite resistance protein B-like protein
MISDIPDQARPAMTHVQLTPLMVLAVALLFMVKADGDIDDHESSQLQAVIGGNEDLLDWAAEFAETISLDEFLSMAPESLQPQDVQCILANVCDSMQSDGQVQDVEMDMFRRMQTAFGITPAAFEPTYKAITFKNNYALLGNYSQEDLTAPTPSPHLAMASTLLFMMAADGDITDEEIGQLQAVIGGFEGLQAAAMKKVREDTLGQFLRTASPSLNEDQKLLILVNVADSMMSDGSIGIAEQNLFDNIQEDFRVSKTRLSPYLKAIEVKNLKPFSTDVDPKAIHTRRADDRKKENWIAAEHASETGEVVHRTMERNIQQVEDGFKDQEDIDLVALHGKQIEQGPAFTETAKDVNLQKLGPSGHQSNLQNVGTDKLTSETQDLATEGGLKNKVQGIGNGNLKDNLQAVGQDALKDNLQGIGNGNLKDNLQGIGNGNLPTHTQALDDAAWGALATELLDQLRVESLQANINVVHGKLDRVKPKQAWQTLDQLRPAKRGSQAPSDDDRSVPKNRHELATTPNASPLQSDASDEAPLATLQALLSSTAKPSVLQALPAQTASTFGSMPSTAPWPDANLPSDGLTETPDATTALMAQRQAHEHDTSMALEEETVGNDQGGIRLRTLLLVLCISIPLVGLAYGFIYPTLSCQGTVHRVQHWHPEGSDSQILLDETNPERQLMQIRRGEINLNNQRFPLYKELNPNNHIAMQTTNGFKGVYSTHSVDQMNYAFEFHRQRGELKISTKSTGVRFIDGQSGKIDVVSDFIGRCENRWY